MTGLNTKVRLPRKAGKYARIMCITRAQPLVDVRGGRSWPQSAENIQVCVFWEPGAWILLESFVCTTVGDCAALWWCFRVHVLWMGGWNVWFEVKICVALKGVIWFRKYVWGSSLSVQIALGFCIWPNKHNLKTCKQHSSCKSRLLITNFVFSVC